MIKKVINSQKVTVKIVPLYANMCIFVDNKRFTQPLPFHDYKYYFAPCFIRSLNPLVRTFYRLDRNNLVREIETTLPACFVADIIIPFIDDLDLQSIRKTFQYALYGNKEKQQRIAEILDRPNCFEDDKYVTLSGREIYIKRYRSEIEYEEETLVFDFKNRPSLHFAGFIERMIVSLAYYLFFVLDSCESWTSIYYGSLPEVSLGRLYEKYHKEISKLTHFEI